MDRQAEGWAETDRQTDRQTDGRMDGQTDRLTETHMHTSNIVACGECTKNDGFSVGDTSRHSCPSQAIGLYVNTIEDESRLSYNC